MNFSDRPWQPPMTDVSAQSDMLSVIIRHGLSLVNNQFTKRTFVLAYDRYKTTSVMGNPSSVIDPIFLALRGAYDSMTDTFNKVQILININTYRKNEILS